MGIKTRSRETLALLNGDDKKAIIDYCLDQKLIQDVPFCDNSNCKFYNQLTIKQRESIHERAKKHNLSTRSQGTRYRVLYLFKDSTQASSLSSSQSPFVFVEYEINNPGLFFGILPTEKLSRDVSKLKKWSGFRLKTNNVETWVKVWMVADYDLCIYTYFKLFEQRNKFKPYDRSLLK